MGLGEHAQAFRYHNVSGRYVSSSSYDMYVCILLLY